MEKINITIPDGLTPQQEIFAIANKLGKALAPPKKQIAIGQGYEVKHLDTQITIRREPTSNLLVTQECSVCKTLFEPSVKHCLYVNYGGVVQKRKYCSDECRDVVQSMCGPGRALPTRSGLSKRWFRESV